MKAELKRVTAEMKDMKKKFKKEAELHEQTE